MSGVGEFVKAGIGSARVGIDVATVSIGALVQPREYAIRMNATIMLRVLCAFAVRLQTALAINTQEGDYLFCKAPMSATGSMIGPRGMVSPL
jgi:hypothetical protein